MNTVASPRSRRSWKFLAMPSLCLLVAGLWGGLWAGLGQSLFQPKGSISIYILTMMQPCSSMPTESQPWRYMPSILVIGLASNPGYFIAFIQRWILRGVILFLGKWKFQIQSQIWFHSLSPMLYYLNLRIIKFNSFIVEKRHTWPIMTELELELRTSHFSSRAFSSHRISLSNQYQNNISLLCKTFAPSVFLLSGWGDSDKGVPNALEILSSIYNDQISTCLKTQNFLHCLIHS